MRQTRHRGEPAGLQANPAPGAVLQHQL